MEFKKLGAAVAAAALVMFPLAACGSANAPVVTTVTATPTTLSPGFQKSYCGINSATKDACAKHDADVLRRQTTAQQQVKSSGLPWWSWLLIVPGGAIGLLVLGLKVLEWNDDRTIARAEARVDELDARAAQRASRVLDYDEWDDEEDAEDELPEEDVAFLHRVTGPTPSAPVPSAPPASGGLLSSLRQQNQ